MPRKDTTDAKAKELQGSTLLKQAAGPEVEADAAKLVADVADAKDVVEEIIDDGSKFIADGKARVALALSPLAVLAAGGKPEFATVKAAIEQAFHELFDHFVSGGKPQPVAVAEDDSTASISGANGPDAS